MSKTQSPFPRIPQPIFGIKTEERNNGKSQEAKIPEGPEKVVVVGGGRWGRDSKSMAKTEN